MIWYGGRLWVCLVKQKLFGLKNETLNFTYSSQQFVKNNVDVILYMYVCRWDKSFRDKFAYANKAQKSWKDWVKYM